MRNTIMDGTATGDVARTEPGGAPAADYAAAASGAVAVVRPDRVVLRLAGRDPVRMLQGLITNDLAGAGAEEPVYAAVLTPKGRMVADARLLRDGDAVLVETAAAAEEGLRAHLTKYVPPLFARLAADAGLALIGVYGPAAGAAVAGAAGVDGPPAPGAVLPIAGVDTRILAPLDLPPGRGLDLIAPAGSLGVLRERLLAAGAQPAGIETVETHRVEAGLPRWGAELDETVIPLEAGLGSRAISTTKGCYTGQEVIVRILHRGHVNRLLRGLLLGDAPVPDPGVVVTVPGGERPVGAVTSAVASPALGQTIALAYLRREVEPGTRVLAGGREATVVELPFRIP